MSFTVYLSGEIHTDWREEIKQGAAASGLDVQFTSAVTDHDASDAAALAWTTATGQVVEMLKYVLKK